MTTADDIIGPPLPEIISRKEAIAKGLKRYFLGHQCPQGHVAEHSIHGGCAVCAYLRHATYKDANRERLKQDRLARYAANPEKKRAAAAKYREANPHKVKMATEKWREENREYRKEYQAAKHAANREQRNAASKAWRAANLEAALEYSRARYASDPERFREQAKAWAAANPEKVGEFHRNRRARKKAAEGRHTAADIQRIYDAQRGKCACCKKKVGTDYHVDHIVPLARGGSNWPANLQVLCPSCNIRKRDADPIDYMQSRGLLL